MFAKMKRCSIFTIEFWSFIVYISRSFIVNKKNYIYRLKVNLILSVHEDDERKKEA